MWAPLYLRHGDFLASHLQNENMASLPRATWEDKQGKARNSSEVTAGVCKHKAASLLCRTQVGAAVLVSSISPHRSCLLIALNFSHQSTGQEARERRVDFIWAGGRLIWAAWLSCPQVCEHRCGPAGAAQLVLPTCFPAPGPSLLLPYPTFWTCRPLAFELNSLPVCTREKGSLGSKQETATSPPALNGYRFEHQTVMMCRHRHQQGLAL